jgi:hypothetical protein
MAIKERFCWWCGESMGDIDSRYYDRRDVCGKLECAREARDADQEDREEAHRELDERNGWS